MSKCTELINNDQFLTGLELVKSKNVFYLITGSIISGLGLLYDSYPVVLGSMLISPMGGPIFRIITSMLNNSITKTYKSIGALIIFYIVAYCIGIIMSLVNEKYDYLESPTNEMKSRTEIERIITDIIIASISGAILAFSMYHKDLVVIVGIGLVLSILPPTVNGGLYHGMYLYKYYNDVDSEDDISKTLIKKGNTSLLLSLINILCVFISGYLILKLFIC